jgi:hypothetical protein
MPLFSRIGLPRRVLGCLVLLPVVLLPGTSEAHAKQSLQTKERALGTVLPPDKGDPPSILLRRAGGKGEWQRLGQKDPHVAAGDALVSLPGYRSDVSFRGVELNLWGDLLELSLVTPLLESAVIVHEPGEFDLDLTLDHGRVALRNTRDSGAARIRLRFDDPPDRRGKHFWDITLPRRGDKVTVDLFGQYPRDVAFARDPEERQRPERHLYLLVHRGTAVVKAGAATFNLQAPPGASLLFWNSKAGTATRPQRTKELPAWATRRLPPLPSNLRKEDEKYLRRGREAMLRALDDLSNRLIDGDVREKLREGLKADSATKRALAVRCLGAIGDVDSLIRGLADKEYPDVRLVAIEDLRFWIGLHAAHDGLLYDRLRELGYTTGQATTVMQLLHSLSDKEIRRPKTYDRLIGYLTGKKPAIRALAHWHLVRLEPEGARIRYDARGPAAQRRRAAAQWRRLIPEGTIPRASRQADRER